LKKKEKVDFDGMKNETNAKAWKEIWSAGHGVGAITKINSAADIINELEEEYIEAADKLNAQNEKLRSRVVK